MAQFCTYGDLHHIVDFERHRRLCYFNIAVENIAALDARALVAPRLAALCICSDFLTLCKGKVQPQAPV